VDNLSGRLHDGNPDAYTRKVMYHLQISWWRRGRDETQLRLDSYMAPAVSNVDGVAGDETLVMAGGEGGVTDLKAISAGTDVVTVTVTTSGGDQAWIYRTSVSSGTGWSKS
jgi:hypothetical protein